VQNTYTTPQNSNLIQFIWRLKKDGFSDKTITNYSKALGRLEKLGADINNPESVKGVIALQEKWSDATKVTLVAAYARYASVNGIQWVRPRYRATNKLPFVPLESEIDALIAYCGKKTSTLLQLLKETGMRIGEALKLKWTDINFEGRAILLNNPEKHSNARSFKISEKLYSMLLRLKKDNELVFGRGSEHSVICNFNHQRRKAEVDLANPRFRQIHFHTVRHWKATTEYHKTKDILHVRNVLGHKSINNTLIYTHLVDFEQSDEYSSATAKTIEEAQKLIESGFEYVTEIDGVKLFRKRK
jgi:integrase/recombinase XerD